MSGLLFVLRYGAMSNRQSLSGETRRSVIFHCVYMVVGGRMNGLPVFFVPYITDLKGYGMEVVEKACEMEGW
jgi:hypothetical protein